MASQYFEANAAASPPLRTTLDPTLTHTPKAHLENFLHNWLYPLQRTIIVFPALDSRHNIIHGRIYQREDIAPTYPGLISAIPRLHSINCTFGSWMARGGNGRWMEYSATRARAYDELGTLLEEADVSVVSECPLGNRGPLGDEELDAILEGILDGWLHP